MIPNFIFEPTTWKIVIAVLLSIIIIFMVRYYLDLRDGNVAEANGKLIIVCGMICSMTIAFLLLALTQSLTLYNKKRSNKIMRYYINGPVIKDSLKKNNLTQKDLCELIQFDMSTFSRALQEAATIDESKIRDICDLLKLDTVQVINTEKKCPVPSVRKRTPSNRINSNIKFSWNKEYFYQKLEENNLTPAALGRQINRDKSIFDKYNRGLNMPSLETAIEICKTLNCSSKKLIGYSEKEINQMAGKDVLEETNEQESAGQTYDYKKIDNQNVIKNIEIINKNIITLSENMNSNTQILLDRIQSLENDNAQLKDLIVKIMETQSARFDALQGVCNKQKPAITPKKIVPSTQTTFNSKCTDSEMENIIHTNADDGDFNSYKGRVYKLIAYISRKKNLTFNQIMHDTYKQFTKIYGLDGNELKKESNAGSAIEGIYNNGISKEIFFNMVCTNASNCK